MQIHVIYNALSLFLSLILTMYVTEQSGAGVAQASVESMHRALLARRRHRSLFSLAPADPNQTTVLNPKPAPLIDDKTHTKKMPVLTKLGKVRMKDHKHSFQRDRGNVKMKDYRHNNL
jgi:hypothetical protein